MNFSALLSSLDEVGYHIWDHYLSAQQVDALLASIPDNLTLAGIGLGDDQVTDTNIRSDRTAWISRSMGSAVSDYLDNMEALRVAVNQQFFLGLFEYEAHYALYKKGDFYERHLDAFREQESRKLTTVLYLNQDWEPSDKGELVIYDIDGNQLAIIPPRAGRLVTFFSEEFPHEVLPAGASRYSIAGWFRINGVTEKSFDIAR